jgi:hypothetical protein
MRKYLFVVFVIFLCMYAVPSLYSEDLPEPGMAPDYEPEDVQVPDEEIGESTAPVNESEIEEKDELENDEEREEKDYNTFENETGEIESGEKSLIQ